MIVSFITTKPPSLASGSVVRSYYLLQSFLRSAKIHKVQLIYINSDVKKSDVKIADPKLEIHAFSMPARSPAASLVAYAKGQVPYAHHLKNHGFDYELLKLINESDIAVLSELDGFFLVQNVLPKISAKTVLDAHNVDAERFASEVASLPPLSKLFAEPLVKVLAKTELFALQNVDHIFACSEHDQHVFFQLVSQQKISLVPNGVKISVQKAAQPSTQFNILFMGLLSYGPNNDGLEYYLNDIHSLVIKELPQAKVTILGKNAPDWLMGKAKLDQSIQLVGYVDSVDPYLKQASLCICPLRFGAGTRLKILEYMAASKPVVSTSIGCDGIDVTSGKNIVIADDPKTFAKSVVNLLKQPKQAAAIGRAGYELVADRYDWKKIGQKAVDVFTRIT